MAAAGLLAGCGTTGGDRSSAAAYLSLPSRYTPLIDAAGSQCPAVTPELIAAQLVVSSGGGANARRGIVPAAAWASAGGDFDGDGRASSDDMADSIPSLGRYTCGLRDRVERLRAQRAIRGDDVDLALAAYRSGMAAVVRARGVPPSSRPYVDAVERAVEQAADGGVASPLPGRDDSDNFGVAGSAWSSGYHTGDDFPAPCGTPVDAATSGVVRIRTGQPWAGIALVEVVAADGDVTWYAHLQRIDIAAGQGVATGQAIGAVGDLGNACGCHLHFEVHPTTETPWTPTAGSSRTESTCDERPSQRRAGGMTVRTRPTSLDVAEARALLADDSDDADIREALFDAELRIQSAHGGRLLPAVIPLTIEDAPAAFLRLNRLLPAIVGQQDVDQLEVALCHASVILAEREWQA